MRRRYKYIEKLAAEYTKATIYCPNCGHSMVLGRASKKICTHCRNYVFKDKMSEFKYRLKESLYKEKRNEQ